jgi:SAM-dependent methyltransferase
MNRGNYARHAAIWNLGSPDRSDEIEFYSSLAKKYGRKVLSLMCATGEIASGMAENSFKVTGVDIEPEMIAAAKKNSHGKDNPHFLTGDVTDFTLPDKDYDFAFIGTGDFHHLLSGEEMLAALDCINTHLKEGGCLVLELYFPEDNSWQAPLQRYDPLNPTESGIKTWKLSESSYDTGTMRRHIRQVVFIEEDGKTESFIHEFDLKLFKRETLVALLKQAGFTITAEYGGYDFSEWHPAADKWIVECMKIDKNT